MAIQAQISFVRLRGRHLDFLKMLNDDKVPSAGYFKDKVLPT